jgi:hypothetical protein
MAESMAGFIVARGMTGLALVGASGLLAGCMGTGVTYGTGTPTEIQTIQDLSGIVSLGTSNHREAIDYAPRAPLVVPPDSNLPPPSDGQIAALANWPTDPEELARLQRERSDAISRANQGQSANLQDPGLNVPTAGSGQQGPVMTEAEALRQMEAMRAGRGGSVDANGQPVRQYLTEPPAEYRVPDPNAPMEVDPNARPGPKKPLFPNLAKLWPF